MSAPWSDFELQCLYDVVNKADWYRKVKQLLPNRTVAAARAKMCALRREAEIVPKYGGPRALSRRATEREKAEIGSRRLLHAMQSELILAQKQTREAA